MAKQEKTAAEKYRAERKARLQKAAKRNKKKPISPQTAKRIDRAFGVIVAVVVVAVICWLVISLSGVIEKNTTVMTIGDEPISQPEYTYYYYQGFNYIAQYGSYMGVSYDSTAMPDAQPYTGELGAIEDFPEDQTPTWFDFFSFNARHSLRQIKAAVKQAEALGLTLDASEEAEIESYIDEMRATASQNSYSLNAYLRASSGKGVDEKLIRKILTEQHLSEKVENHKSDELKEKVTDQEVESAFYADIATYGVVSYRTFDVDAASEEITNDDGETVNQVTDKTMKAAKKTADEIAAAKSEEEFLDLVAKAANDKNYKTDDSLTLMTDQSSNKIDPDGYNDEEASWLFSDEAVAGATYVKETANLGYTVFYVTEAVHKPGDSLTYDVRHILVKFPEDEEEEPAEEAEAAEKTELAEAAADKDQITVEPLDLSKYDDIKVVLDVNGETAKDKATYQKAQNILQEYLEGTHSEDAFADMAKKYSEDGNASSGGLYEKTALGIMVPEFESWAVAKGRKAGDVGIVETDYGYHIMYFVKKTPVPWDDAIKTAVVRSQVEEYMHELGESDTAALTLASEKTLAKVDQTLLKSARTQIRNAASQMQSYY